MTEQRVDLDLVMATGEDLYIQGRYQEAIDTFDQAPESPAALKIKAKALTALARVDDAVACYDRIIELVPDHPSPLNEKAAFMTSQGQYAEAIRLYDQGVSLAPNSAAIHRDRALALRLNDDSDSALTAYDRALEIDDRDSDTWAGKADLLIELKRYRDAIVCLEKAAVAPDGNFGSSGWTNRGYSMARAGALDEAIHCYDRAIERDPEDTLAFVGKAYALQGKNDLDGALACFDRAIKIRPDDSQHWFEKGEALKHAGRLNEALECYDSALELDPNYKLSWTNRGDCLTDLGRPSDALDAYSKVVEIDSGDAYAWETMGSCLIALERPRASVRAFERALELDPNLAWADNNLGWVLSRRLEQHERALTHFDRSIKLQPYASGPLTNKAYALIELGRVEEARSLLEWALQKVHDKGVILQSLGALLADQLDDIQKALELFEQAEELGAVDESSVLSIAELLIRLDRHEEARERASPVLENASNSELRCVASFLLLASHALEGDVDVARTQFEDFIERVCNAVDPASDKPAVGFWNYKGFVRTIAQSTIDLETKFVLLVAIDLQRGRLAAPSLAELPLSLPLTTPPSKPSAPPTEPEFWFSDMIRSATTWLHDHVIKD